MPYARAPVLHKEGLVESAPYRPTTTTTTTTATTTTTTTTITCFPLPPATAHPGGPLLGVSPLSKKRYIYMYIFFWYSHISYTTSTCMCSHRPARIVWTSLRRYMARQVIVERVYTLHNNAKTNDQWQSISKLLKLFVCGFQ